MNLHLYDTKSRSLQPLKPVHEGEVGIYLCGATVQGSPHIGHLRSAVAFDTLIRWLKKNGMKVTYIRNITDIDDKILNKSAEAGQPWWAWASKFEREFAQAYDALGLLPPTFEPRATAHILDQVQLVERLIERGHAYPDGAGNVYFDVHSLDDYGSLTHQDLAQMRTTEDESQIDSSVEAGKRDPRDFALWKAAKPTEPSTASWQSPWGPGRPGWHLECSAMSRRYLGEAFDIHGGGIDLRFPHHENEQAQSHGAGWPFASLWVHNAWVTMKGEKMSKSLGNSLVVADILQRVPAPVLRFALGTVHHRSTVDYSEETIHAAAAAWERISGFVQRAGEVAGVTESEVAERAVPQAFADALDNDLNVAGGLAVVYERMKAGNQALADGSEGEVREALLDVRAMLDILGLDPASPQWVSEEGDVSGKDKALDVLVNHLIEQREQARAAKDWSTADSIRDGLAAAGVVVEDGADGARWHIG
ncbi:cysteine--tRNA ligase [Gleimia europaea]|uniref:Cysteine--tRNA ligase n=1 Tax=Gleimia europaea ACS-120-V-Col10b TaxID=883069 RepID=A0A9W5RFM9_9ACTO|nr:cysteine--tRNA ligase [Gleimia europaea]EPD31510.1 cysteine-tRNA ligase [Gleimia europaea ACS-120-V-Col10b]